MPNKPIESPDIPPKSASIEEKVEKTKWTYFNQGSQNALFTHKEPLDVSQRYEGRWLLRQPLDRESSLTDLARQARLFESANPKWAVLMVKRGVLVPFLHNWSEASDKEISVTVLTLFRNHQRLFLDPMMGDNVLSHDGETAIVDVDCLVRPDSPASVEFLCPMHFAPDEEEYSDKEGFSAAAAGRHTTADVGLPGGSAEHRELVPPDVWVRAIRRYIEIRASQSESLFTHTYEVLRGLVDLIEVYGTDSIPVEQITFDMMHALKNARAQGLETATERVDLALSLVGEEVAQFDNGPNPPS